MEAGGGHTAAADVALLYSATHTWFTSERNYKVGSCCFLKRITLGWVGKKAVRYRHQQELWKKLLVIKQVLSQSMALKLTILVVKWASTHLCVTGAQGFTSPPVRLNMDDLNLDRAPTAAALHAGGCGEADSTAMPPGKRPGLTKKYGSGFVWGQLNAWFKQTVYDPAASLSAERRGTLSLPDPESCYAGRSRYTARVGTSPCHLCMDEPSYSASPCYHCALCCLLLMSAVAVERTTGLDKNTSGFALTRQVVAAAEHSRGSD